MPSRLDDTHLVYTIPSQYDKIEYVESLQSRILKNKDIKISKIILISETESKIYEDAKLKIEEELNKSGVEWENVKNTTKYNINRKGLSNFSIDIIVLKIYTKEDLRIEKIKNLFK